ncbi:hypothetical protein SAY86_031779 [Trapa natans]|uniref:Uncharacterized protein n=1 Tax=Trapa natans TaxID=22666 RepID=A0AAN7LRX7_TRANT|nr:hypothetical protein SAY86_031779 [Trapa natans]
MKTKAVGRASSRGRSPTVREMKYEDRWYIPEFLSLRSILRSCGKGPVSGGKLREADSNISDNCKWWCAGASAI